LRPFQTSDIQAVAKFEQIHAGVIAQRLQQGVLQIFAFKLSKNLHFRQIEQIERFQIERAGLRYRFGGFPTELIVGKCQKALNQRSYGVTGINVAAGLRHFVGVKVLQQPVGGFGEFVGITFFQRETFINFAVSGQGVCINGLVPVQGREIFA
jgi:hypothetical protein